MCCGRNRTQSAQVPTRTVPAGPLGITFEYTGRTGVTVVGRSTGRQYRFDRAGARVQVDPRDSASVAAVPVLKRLQPPAGR
jgi:hypothetical protein